MVHPDGEGRPSSVLCGLLSACLDIYLTCLALVDIWGHRPHPRSWAWFYRREAPKGQTYAHGFEQVTFGVWPNIPWGPKQFTTCWEHTGLVVINISYWRKRVFVSFDFETFKGNTAPWLVYVPPGKKWGSHVCKGQVSRLLVPPITSALCLRSDVLNIKLSCPWPDLLPTDPLRKVIHVDHREPLISCGTSFVHGLQPSVPQWHRVAVSSNGFRLSPLNTSPLDYIYMPPIFLAGSWKVRVKPLK